MNSMARFVKSLFRRRSLERDMQDEFSFHLDMESADLASRGVPAAEARRLARVGFGGVEGAKEAARDGRRFAWLDDLARDARYAGRQMRRSPGFAAVVVITLAVGIGATSTIFSVVNGVLLRPLPYASPSALVAVTGLSYKGEFVQLRDQARTFEIGAYGIERDVSLTGSGEPARLVAAPATAQMFDVLGVSSLLGRTFRVEESQPGAAPPVLLSHATWQQRFGGEPGLVGQQLTIDGTSRTVIGVMPAHFRFPSRAVELWVPLVIREGDPIDLWAQSARMIGRLRGGATPETAHAEVQGHVPRMRTMFPWRMPAEYGSAANVIPLQEHIVGDVRATLLLLLGAAGAVLAIVCVNVANLMLARGMSRQREMAIRAAIGAGRGRIFRQMVAESVTLAALAGAIGIALAFAGLGAATAWLPPDVPRVDDVAMDARVLGFACAVSVACGLLFGVWPAIRCSAARIEPALRESGRTAGIAPSQRRVTRVLVTAEVALAVVLVTSAGLLVRSFWNLTSVDPGFRVERLVAAKVAPPEFRFRDQPARRAFVTRLLDRLRVSPGVAVVSASTAVPFGGTAYPSVFSIQGRPDPATQSGEWPLADAMATVDTSYFAAIGTSLLSGRAFTDEDRAGAPPVAVVSRSLAERYWPGQTAIGGQIKFPGGREWITIVGVAANVKWNSLAEENTTTLYRPVAQGSIGPVTVIVRTSGEPAAVAAALRGIVATLDADTPVTDVRTADALIGESVSKPRFTASLLAVFALVALFLGAVGIYGVLAYTVTRRTQEIGVRMALGARRADVVGLILRQGATVAVAGIVLGLAGALLAARGFSSLLFGVTAADPVVFGTVAVTLLGVALCASLIPAIRASRVDPVTALRND